MLGVFFLLFFSHKYLREFFYWVVYFCKNFSPGSLGEYLLNISVLMERFFNDDASIERNNSK